MNKSYMDLEFKKGKYEQWKHRQPTPEESINITSVYRNRVVKVSAWLELKQLREVEDKKKGFYISEKKNKSMNQPPCFLDG